MGYAFKDNGREWRMVASENDLLPGEEYSEAEPVKPPSTPGQIIAQYTGAVQQHLDTFARTRNYDGILSATTYAASTVPKFAAEGQYAVIARDNTWAAAYQLLAEVEAGTRTVPTMEEILSELPTLTWPQ